MGAIPGFIDSNSDARIVLFVQVFDRSSTSIFATGYLGDHRHGRLGIFRDFQVLAVVLLATRRGARNHGIADSSSVRKRISIRRTGIRKDQINSSR